MQLTNAGGTLSNSVPEQLRIDQKKGNWKAFKFELDFLEKRKEINF